MKTVKSTISTEVITSEDGLHTYEVIKRLDDGEGECATLISLYPTRCEKNIHANDSTLNHLISHFGDLGMNELHIINLFSKVVNSKMSVRGLTVDKDNMQYIDKLMAGKKFQSGKFIVAWGNSFQTSAAVTESKEKVLELFSKHCPKGKLYQLCAVGRNLDSDIAPHPLYIGIHGSNCRWGLKEYSLPKAKSNQSSKGGHL